jgi:galactokinase
MTAGLRSGVPWLQPTSDEVLAERAAEVFAKRFDGAPDGVWLAPGRVNLIGEHIDYVGAQVLPFALPYATAAAVRRRDDDLLRCASSGQPEVWTGHVGDVGPGRPANWAAYTAGVPWAMLYHGTIARYPGLDIAVHSDLPHGAGLSSSAALESAVALAIAELLGAATDDHGRGRLARDCVTAENVVVGASTGGMDQSAALRSRPGHVMLLDCTDFTAEHIPLDLSAAGLALMIINTNAPHRLVDSTYGLRRARVERISARIGQRALRNEPDIDAVLRYAIDNDPELMRRMRHILSEIRRVGVVADKLRAGAVAEIGAELTASHASLRDDYEVSSIELDSAVEAALSAGALGARMTGGGFGGSAIALAPIDKVGAVAENVTRAAHNGGLPAPQFLNAVPTGAAHRVR